jgi:hypothetical protein
MSDRGNLADALRLNHLDVAALPATFRAPGGGGATRESRSAPRSACRRHVSRILRRLGLNRFRLRACRAGARLMSAPIVANTPTSTSRSSANSLGRSPDRWRSNRPKGWDRSTCIWRSTTPRASPAHRQSRALRPDKLARMSLRPRLRPLRRTRQGTARGSPAPIASGRMLAWLNAANQQNRSSWEQPFGSPSGV